MRPIQNIAQHVRAMVAERDLCLRDVIPADYPAWPTSLVAKARDIDLDRAAAINRQLAELRDVMVELNLLTAPPEPISRIEGINPGKMRGE